MKTGYVIGNPIDYSLSPAIFKYLADKFKQDFVYEKKQVLAEEVSAFKESCKNSHFLGCNITYPLKDKIIKNEKNISEEVRFLKAANVMTKKNNEFYFYNTDGEGFVDSLEGLKINSLALYGFGNTTRAILYALCKNNMCTSVFIKVRDLKNENRDWIETFKQEFPESSISVVPYIPKVDMVVNTLPRTAVPDDDFFDFKDQESLLIYDVNYGDTPFLNRYQYAQKKQGLSMLIYQALATWGIWFEPIEKQARKQIHDDLFEKLNVEMK